MTTPANPEGGSLTLSETRIGVCIEYAQGAGANYAGSTPAERDEQLAKVMFLAFGPILARLDAIDRQYVGMLFADMASDPAKSEDVTRKLGRLLWGGQRVGGAQVYQFPRARHVR